MFEDFSGQNLCGQCFKTRNLSKANFKNADIRGADFRGANLENANFSGSKTGLRLHWVIFIILISSLLSALSGFLFLFNGAVISQIFSQNPHGKFAAWAALIVTTIVFVTMLRQGIQSLIAAFAVTAAGAFAATISGRANPVGAIAFVIAVVGAGTGCAIFAFAFVESVVGAISGILAVIFIETEVLFFGFIQSPYYKNGAFFLAKNLLGVNTIVERLAFIFAIAEAIISTYIAWRIIKGDQKYTLLRNVVIAFASFKGTTFYNANLTNTNFTGAILKSTDFRKAKLTRTRFYGTKKIDFARFGKTILANPKVVNLLITGNGREKSYAGVNLQGANLEFADLTAANLKDVDITEATLQQANLEWANLTRAQALDTDFTNAMMTGACIEAWNIESTTKLDNVDCRFVYLLENPPVGTDDKERRPSSGEFARGEFSKLFQRILNTVDIIFSNGIDWKAFIQCFVQVQAENEAIELSVNSIENKGDGVFIIKVNIPANANKERIHRELVTRYEEQLKILERRYNSELEARDRDIIRYRQKYTDIYEITKLLADKQANSIYKVHQPVTEKVVLFKFDSLDDTKDLSVTVQIWLDNNREPISIVGNLPPATEIIKLYNHICNLCHQEENNYHSFFPQVEVSNFSIKEIQDLSNELKEKIDLWFNSSSFLSINYQLRTKLNISDSIRFIVQTSDIKLKLLPFHLWNFFSEYRKAEIALSAPKSDRLTKSIPIRKKVRVLVILGNTRNIEKGVQHDLETLNQLPLAEIEVLVQPTLHKLHKQLWHPLGWDILCFSGHSDSENDGSTGVIEISPTETLSLKYLKNALTNAVEKGLQLAIFNSCKGLGIAQDLSLLYIPQIIVMRQPIPDTVAQVFLKNFLQAFANGNSLYNSVREARHKLEGLEDTFPCASWLPVICQNPAEVPLKWFEFPGAGKPQLKDLLTQLQKIIEEDYTIATEDKTEALEQVKLIAKALHNQDAVVKKRQLKTHIRLLRGIILEQPTASFLSSQVNQILADIYRFYILKY